jgi:hypothetical protein
VDVLEVADLASVVAGRDEIDAVVAFEVVEEGLGLEDPEGVLPVGVVAYSAALISMHRTAVDLTAAGDESAERVADQEYAVAALAVELAMVVQTQSLAEVLEAHSGMLVDVADVADVGMQSEANILHLVVGIELDVLHGQHALVLQQSYQLPPAVPVVAFDLPLPLLCELPTTQSCSLIASLTSLASSGLYP